ncbi:MAG: HAMP domain-containing protein [Deltaproteobacteria bacterium]|nr:HAMP domain-containing protein [Deltaproteobacteria bacterium]
MGDFLSNLNLKTKLLFMMVSLCFLSIAFLLFLYAQAEKDLIDEVRRHTEELSTAIQISIEQISKTPDAEDLDSLKSLMNIKKKGIKEISVINNDRDVIASSNPRLIGRKLVIKGESIKSIGNLTEYTTTTDGQKRYDILLPVIIGKDRLGYVHLETQFDDFTSIARNNHRNRLIATLAIFTIGILAAVYLSKKYTEPIQSIAEAAQKVAGGDLSVRLEVKGDNEVEQLTNNFNDMVRKLRENRELQARLKEAEHMSKIGALASGIAHEVRNPLNLINLSIDHLRAVHAPSEEDKKEVFLSTVANIKSEIERLDGMVSNFLNFGRPLNLNLKEIPLEPVIDETIALLGDRCAEQNISIELTHSDAAPAITADYRHIKTCFLNLFLNAIQSMPAGGRVKAETSLIGPSVIIRIDDTGCGIEPGDMHKIFEPYFTTKDLGIGLGLALTKRIIEEHGGKIHITSQVGKGTTVTLTLPAVVRV